MDVTNLVPGLTSVQAEELKKAGQDSIFLKQSEYLKARGWIVYIQGPFGPDYMRDPKTGKYYQTAYATRLQAYRDGLLDDYVTGMMSMLAPVRCTSKDCKNWAWPPVAPATLPWCPACGGPIHEAPGVPAHKLQKAKKASKAAKVAKAAIAATPGPAATATAVGAKKRAELKKLMITGLEDYTDEELAWAKLNCNGQEALGGEASAVLTFVDPAAPPLAFVNVAGNLVPFKNVSATKKKIKTPQAAKAEPEQPSSPAGLNAFADSWEEWE